MIIYRTHGVCAHEIMFDVVDNKIYKVRFIGGCSGNHQGIARLIEGKDIDEVISTLSGVACRNNTSCPDQLAKALIEYKQNH